MAYPECSLKDTDKSIKEIKALRKNLEDAKKKKDKNAIKVAEKNLDKCVKDASKVVKAAIEGAEKNFKAHQKQVAAYFKMCKDYLKIAQKALKNQDTDVASYGVPSIKSVSDLAEKDADDYGKSWFKVRGFNNAGDVDPKVGDDFNKRVGVLMNNGKFVTQQVQQMKSWLQEAESLADEAKRLARQGLEDIEDARKRAQKLADEVAAIHDNMRNHHKQGLNQLTGRVKSLQDWAGRDPSMITAKLASNLKSIYTDAMACMQGLFQQETAIKNKCEMVKSGFSKTEMKDGDISKSIKAALNTQKTAEKDVKMAEKAVKMATAHYTKIQKMGAGK